MKQIYIGNKPFVVEDTVANEINMLNKRLYVWRSKCADLTIRINKMSWVIKSLKETAMRKLEKDIEYLGNLLEKIRNKGEIK